ncbi:MAG: carboxy terminal-processing peptidase [Pseudomonadota bacterium]
MKTAFSILLITLLLLTGSSLSANVPEEIPLSELNPSLTHQKAMLLTTRVMQRYHYKSHQLDDSFSQEILHKYLEMLDPNKGFFTKSDIDEFQLLYSDILDDDIKNARLEASFTIFKRFRQRVDQRMSKALELVDYPFDFTIDEDYLIDREDAKWAVDQRALDELWRKRVKNDTLAQHLMDKDDKEIKEKLAKRYQGTQRRTRQMSADDIFQTFMNAYTGALEPHTGYMLPHNAENFDITMRLSLQGIGAVLKSDSEYTSIQSIVPGGPADKSGQLHAGDKVVGVAQGRDGEMIDVVGWKLQKVVEKIRGKKGSTVRLNIIMKKSGSSEITKEIILVRDKIKLEEQAVKASVTDDLEGLQGKRIGVIDVPTFYRDFQGASSGNEDFRSTTRDVRKALKELQEKGVDGIVIDLRDNGGGSLTEATELTGLFIDSGPIVQVKDYSGGIEAERDPDPEIVYSGPLLVMVNRNSASASEIFSGAIQDYGRGIIIGEPTFGKGTVQQLIDLSNYVSSGKDMGRLRLTIAQFFRVNGASTQHRGVTPDISFPTIKDSDYGERSYENALPWSKIKAANYAGWKTFRLNRVESNHKERIKKDSGFIYLQAQAELFHNLKSEKTVSLNESKRQAEWEQKDQQRRALRNEYRRSIELKPLTKADEDNEDLVEKIDEEEKVDEIERNEAARILADVIQQHSQPVVRAAQSIKIPPAIFDL